MFRTAGMAGKEPDAEDATLQGRLRTERSYWAQRQYMIVWADAGTGKQRIENGEEEKEEKDEETKTLFAAARSQIVQCDRYCDF
jgi:hypothetical protein